MNNEKLLHELWVLSMAKSGLETLQSYLGDAGYRPIMEGLKDMAKERKDLLDAPLPWPVKLN